MLHPDSVPAFFTRYSDDNPDPDTVSLCRCLHARHNAVADSGFQRHISGVGHQVLGDMVSIYMRDQLCETRRRLSHPPPDVAPDTLWPKGDALGLVPRLHVWERVTPTLTWISY